MEFQAYILSNFISFCIFLQSGCSIGPIIHITANDTSLKESADVRLMRSDNRPDFMIKSLRDYIGCDFDWQADGGINKNKVYRIKYHRRYFKNGYIAVEGRIGHHANRYPVVLDTGASQPIFLTASQVIENNLSIYPAKEMGSELNGHRLGICRLSQLQIGDITFTNRPCLYLEPPASINLLGVRVAGKNSHSDTAIIGLPVLREFKYLMFDNIRNVVEFSYNQTFEPNEPERWGRYPISVQEDFHGNAFLYITIPLAGNELELQFDSGSGRGLAIGEKLWEQVGINIPDLNLKKGKDLYPYIGRLACRKGVIPKLQVGNRMIKDAEVSIFPNDSPLLAECEGLMGMQYFRNIVVVLDFDKSQLWLGNSGALK